MEHHHKFVELTTLHQDYGPVPFWFWNDELDYEHLDRQLREMRDQHVYEAIIHARKGLQIEYLSEEWFDRVAFVIERGKEYGIRFWIYDEENWPSGFAAGKVTEINPEYCGKHLRMEKVKISQISSESLMKAVALLIETEAGYQNILHQFEQFVKEEGYLFTMDFTIFHPVYTNALYVDLLNREATRCFMELTHEEYAKRFKEAFGKTIKGFFVDEPGFYHNLYMFEGRHDLDTIVWTDDFPKYFIDRNGYDILVNLPHLWFETEKSAQIRYDFYQTVASMYVENFIDPLRHFCESYGMDLIGHVNYEDYLPVHINMHGDMTKIVGALSQAGLDRIDQNNEKITEKLISSIGHFTNKHRVLSETYALSGWGLDFQEMKRIADYQYVRGVNLLNPSAFYSSIEGDRKWECPPSEFIQNPYWKYYHRFSDYITRLSYILSQGVHVCDIGIYYPLPTAYTLNHPHERDRAHLLDQFIQNVAFTLLENQYDFDFLTDDAIQRGELGDECLTLYGESYHLIILPMVTTLPYETAVQLDRFLASGGKLIILSRVPTTCTDIERQECFEKIMETLMERENCFVIKGYHAFKSYTYKFDIVKFERIYNQKHVGKKVLRNDLDPNHYDLIEEDYFRKDVLLERKDPHIKYLHRRMDTCEVYFFTNEDDRERHNHVRLKCVGSVCELDLIHGTATKIPSEIIGDTTKIPLNLPAFGSKLVMIDPTEMPVDDHRVSIPTYLDTPLMNTWNITIDGKTYNKIPLKHWGELGYPYYSGEAIYETTLGLSEEQLNSKEIELIINDFRDCVELIINGEVVDVKLWAPYTFNIKPYLHAGNNQVVLKVVNTLYNRFHQKDRRSGIRSPIRLRYYI